MFQSNRFISLPKLSSNIAPSSMSLSSSSIQATSSNSTQSKRLEKNSNIFDRYEGEIAPPAKLKQYQSIGDKYKQHLIKEAQELQAQYSEDIQHVQEVEESVERIASMLSEFVRILHIQTDQVEDIHDSSEEATESVKRSNRELQTTIDRSKSHQWNMVMLAISLAIMLLLLDWITP
jgi:Fe2+ transport system protein B